MPKPNLLITMSVETHLEEALTKQVGVRKTGMAQPKGGPDTYVIRYREHRPLC